MRTIFLSVSLLAAILVGYAEGITVGKTPMVFDESERAIDKVAPTTPFLELRRIWRGSGPIQVDSVASWNSDGDGGSIYFLVSNTTDDRTATDAIGYRLYFVDGELPRRLEVTSDAYLGHPWLHWDDGATWEQEPFIFRVRATAVDRAGNESTPSNIVIVSHNGDMSGQKSTVELHEQRMRIYANRLGLGEDAQALSKELFVDLNPPPAHISEKYSNDLVKCLSSIRSARIDRVAPRDGIGAVEGSPFERDPSLVTTETGRDLTGSEILQLTTMLLNPKTYIADTWKCGFIPRYAFTLETSVSSALLLLGADCSVVVVRAGDSIGGASVAKEWSPILQGFCDGILSLPAIAESR